jgi:hypothetical protein
MTDKEATSGSNATWTIGFVVLLTVVVIGTAFLFR